MFGRLIFIILFALALVPTITFVAHGQSTRESPMYLRVNELDKNKVMEVWSDTLFLQYNDRFGRYKNIKLRVFDWTRSEVGQFSLGKDKGLNSYKLALSEILPAREKKQNYTFVMNDESGKNYRFLIRFVDPPKRPEISAQVMINPKYLNCGDELAGNLIEFLGSISEGKAPYKVTWYVLNANRTEFLYQPKVQLLDRPGTTATILVDKSPEYYVVMTAIDDCKSEQHQVIHITCQNGKKSVNTVFFESVKEMTTSKPIQ